MTFYLCFTCKIDPQAIWMMVFMFTPIDVNILVFQRDNKELKFYIYHTFYLTGYHIKYWVHSETCVKKITFACCIDSCGDQMQEEHKSKCGDQASSKQLSCTVIKTSNLVEAPRLSHSRLRLPQGGMRHWITSKHQIIGPPSATTDSK